MAQDQFWKTHITSELSRMRAASLLREMPPVDHGAELYLTYEGERLLNLASNNYLGLSGHAALRDHAARAALEGGAGSGASRIVTGTDVAYDALEREVAAFKGTQAALVVGSGYAANLSIMTALAGRTATVFSDRLNHASIIDGITLSRARHVRYRHNDMDHLRRQLEAHADAAQKILVTDSVFSMDGDCADLESIVRLCRDHGALLVVDEAHATGVLGDGKGLSHALGCAGEVDVQMGTFSKALGSYGAYIAADEDIIALIRNRGRSFVFSTSLPPSVVAANRAALRSVATDTALAGRLTDLSQSLRGHLDGLGFDTGGSTTQIIPVILGDNDAAIAAREYLRRKGLYVPAIRPPTVPQGTARLRISLRADISDKVMDDICAAFTDLAQERGVCRA
ncbi:8-amino-7-oxononanoate synthase [Desulfobaculum sp.]